ncbi:MAG TPA: glycoside hydrolase family 18 protein [Tepidisphaeraceae bacterium]|nr:glycoside hydrolase family 18 protein [Tepidisphaeraceae bacterium]
MSLALLALLLVFAGPRVSAAEPWVSGYYPGWEQDRVPPAKIPFDAVTHVFHFACVVRPDGTLNTSDFMLTDAHVKETVAAARAAAKKVVIVLGGADSEAGFVGATSDDNRQRFIANIVDFARTHGYDGVDIDWEPLSNANNEQFRRFVVELRAKLRAHDPQALLTAATGTSLTNREVGRLFAGLQDELDQINLMTYVLAGAWEGWVTWHGAALSNGGARFGEAGREMPSVETNMREFVTAGVRPEKLGIGLAFHGSVWAGGEGTDTGGVTRLKQGWTTPPKVDVDVGYADIMRQYYAPDRLRFDEVAQSPYLSIDRPGAADDRFVSFTDARAITARLAHMTEQRYGGCIVWNIAQDALPTGEHPLADAIIAFRQRPAR